MTKEPLPGVFQLTPLNPAFNDNPHLLLDRLRNECPVHRDDVAGTFLLTRYADVRGVVSDTSLWRGSEHAEDAAVIQKAAREERLEGMTVPEDELRTNILTLDDPDHARIRTPFAKALYKRVAKVRPLVR